MTVIDDATVDFRVDAQKASSTDDEIKQLETFSPISIPTEFIELIRSGSEFEILVKGDVYIRIWGAAGCLEMNEAYEVQDNIGDSLAIGDNEGGSALMYMTGPKGFGVYMAEFGCLDADEAVFIAPSLHELLVNNVGIDRLQ